MNKPKGYEELAKIDKLIYDNGIELCKNCPGLKNCKQVHKGHYPTIIQDKTFKTYRIAFLRCDKIIGSINDENVLKEKFDTTEVKQINEIMNSVKNKRSLYLWGRVGVGKSHVAKYLAKKYFKRGARVYYGKMNTILNDYFGAIDYENEKSFVKHLENIDVLVIDDLGNENITNFSMSGILFPIIDYRLENEKMTIITSNYSVPNELLNRYSRSEKIDTAKQVAPTISRIDGNEIYDKYEIKGINFRKGGIK
jgi:DNA replication protein DnaC